MVTKTEETQLNRLESQLEHGGGGAWDYLCLVRKLKVRRSEKVLKHGLSILNDPKRSSLGHDEWTLYEQVAIAAMDCQSLDVAKDCINVLQKRFPESKRVGGLEGMLLEAKGSWTEAEKAYLSLLEDNPLDQVIYKRRVALAKAQGKVSEAIEFLNKYLEIFMADSDAWRELAEIYVSLQMYKQAAFCYEELILSQPTVPLYHLAYADVLYTLGGLENLQAAKKYYSSTIDLTGGKNTRALFGICLCTSAIAQLTKGRNKEDKDSPDLQSLATAALEKEYKHRASGKEEQADIKGKEGRQEEGIASEGLKHRVFEVSLADLQKDEDHAYRKIRLRAEDVQGRNVLTNFWGMDFTTDKLRSLVRKWQTLIEAHVDVKTTDNYTLRLFCIAFTKRRANQVKRTCYAQSSQIRQIRRKMREIMVNQAASCDLKELVAKFIPEMIGREIEKATSSIYPLQNVFIRKVKILKAPKFDLGKLMEVHGDYSADDIGVKLDRPADETMAEGETEVLAQPKESFILGSDNPFNFRPFGMALSNQ
ncbi:hypothetical protein GH714_002816 [Hevea brasiliensis]|uniref:Small ribosomal subunit protein eS1 n=1 Tax=Hevea brasiliensis TaxID=3981 RepID=A0A6A6KHM9_HEVBR|nr:hypothetical protein GH714_002816 [Hevea brasiliensis]